MNGTIRASGFDGIDASQSEDCTFADLRLIANGQQGISMGARCTILRCVAIDNGGTGLQVGSVTGATGVESVVDSCRAERNGLHGIVVGDASVVTRCVSEKNGQGGGGDGYTLGKSTVCTDGVASGNAGFGYYSSHGNVTLRSCTADWNTSVGIYTGIGCVVEGCTASSNTDDGIGLGASIIRGCTARSNGRDGIRADTGCLVTGSECEDNLGAGIRVIGPNNRIDENSATGNDIGFHVSGLDNVIVRNSAGSNTTSQFDIVGGNDVGTIQTSPVGAGAWDNLSF